MPLDACKMSLAALQDHIHNNTQPLPQLMNPGLRAQEGAFL
jgi:hypothetical protein